MNEQLYINANILTMLPKTSAAQALLVKEGRIVALGSERKLSGMAPNAEKIDLQGHTLMPGFIDGHSHLMATAYKRLIADLSPAPAGTCNSREDLIRTLKEWQKRNPLPPGRWLMGMGYDNSVYQDGKHPSRQELDCVSSEIPVLAVHASGHLAVANTKAMELLGYLGEGPAVPAGGSVEANGLLKEQAFLAPEKQMLIGAPAPAELLESLKETSILYASYGYTTVQEGRAGSGEAHLLEEAGKRHLLVTDVVEYFTPETAEKYLPKQHPSLNLYRNHCRAGGCKIFLDGSPQGKTAWLSKPYLIPPEDQEKGYCGFPLQSGEEVLAVMRRCLKNRWQLNVHANGDAAIEQMIDCYDAALRDTDRNEGLRPVIIHCQTVREDQLKRMKQLGILPSFFLDHVYYWGDYHVSSVLGIERAKQISPAVSAWKLGIPFTLHQDTPVVPPNALLSIHNAVNRQTLSGCVLGEEQRIPVHMALRALTDYAAYQIFEEKEKGSLLPGKRADFVVLSGNPLETPKEELKDICVLNTIKDGVQVYSKN